MKALYVSPHSSDDSGDDVDFCSVSEVNFHE